MHIIMNSEMTRPPMNAPSSPSSQPLAATALYEQVADRLRQRILERDLEPGSWLDERSLCEQLGISRTPMREAIKVLASEGLVTMKLRRGAYVTEMNERDVREAYQLLALLESDACGIVAATASESQMTELKQVHEKLEAAATQRESFFAANEQFHLLLLAIEGNRWRQSIVGDLRRLMKLNRHHSLFHHGRLTESLQEHRGIMNALLERDANRAKQLMGKHFENGLAATSRANKSP